MRFQRFLEQPFRTIFYLQAALYLALYISSLLAPASLNSSGIPINDKILHFIAHLTLAVSLYLAFRSFGLRFPVKIALAITFFMAVGTELGQHFSAGREPSWLDFAANLLGLLCGYVVIVLIRNFARKKLAEAPQDSSRK